MKKILIFGAGGMIGHQMYLTLKEHFYVIGTIKKSLADYKQFKLFDKNQIVENFDISDFNSVCNFLDQVKPDVLLNCVGITLRKETIKNFEITKKINSDFPHFLKQWVNENNKYLIHFSTDCVFSGKSGPYTEESCVDATDTYGVTKGLGEVTGLNTLTLRGSMIGFELLGKSELLEWVISQRNQAINGYEKAIYSGITVFQMSKLITQIIESHKPLKGLYNVSSLPISKYDLVSKINEVFKLNIHLVKDSTYSTEKILISKKLENDFGFYCPGWSVMLEELYAKFIISSK